MSNTSAPSVLQRILNESRKLGVTHELLTRRYVFERFLVRLSQSEWREKLVLKGAMALVAVTRNYGRTTRDMDMLGLQQLTSGEALAAIKAIASVAPSDGDPVVFDVDAFKVDTINVEADEPGHQITGEARIGNAKIPLKIEISHGHLVSPTPAEMNYPTVLADGEAPNILCYTPETKGGKVRGDLLSRDRNIAV